MAENVFIIESACLWLEDVSLCIPHAGSGDGQKYRVLEGHAGQRFRRLVLTKAMFDDHLCTTYLAALDEVLGRT